VTATRQSWTEKERPLAIGSPHHGYQPPCVGFTAFSAVAVILAHGGRVKPLFAHETEAEGDLSFGNG